MQRLDCAGSGGQAPVRRPGDHCGVAVNDLVALEVAGSKVVEFLVAKLGDDGVALRVGELVESALEAVDQVGHRNAGASPVDDIGVGLAGTEAGGIGRLRVEVIHAFDKPFALGGAVPVAVLRQRDIHGVEVVA